MPTIGFAAAPSVLLLLYGSEVTRHFDVLVTQGDVTFTQEDEQGMLRYGVGVEVSAWKPLHVRLKAGSGRADFGDARTNVEPDRPIQLALGVSFQF